jgi:hypothetical protein
MACEDDKVVVDVVGIETLGNEPFLAMERDVIQTLKKTLQFLPL